MTPPFVLLNVDDHESARYARGRILSSAGFRVHDASSGAEALELAEKHRPDLVLLDVHLPDGSGVDVCRKLKLAKRSSLMVLQISASALSAAHAKEALDAGADTYLMEPVDPDVLVATVKALLRLQQAERSLLDANRKLESVNKELKRSNEDLQQFAFAASHDLQEPLRTVSIFTQLIELDVKDQLGELHQNHFKRVIDGAARMQTLINDLLAYSQVGREGRVDSAVELSSVLREAISNLEQLKEPGCTVETSEPLPCVWGDFMNLVSLFHNLLSNCLKYRSLDRSLIVQILAEKTAQDEWTIRVKDNGIGIAEKYQTQIFEPFKRLHGAEIPGTGIGLALSKRIVELSGGRIWVESHPNEGASLCFTLRANRDAVSEAL